MVFRYFHWRETGSKPVWQNLDDWSVLCCPSDSEIVEIFEGKNLYNHQILEQISSITLLIHIQAPKSVKIWGISGLNYTLWYEKSRKVWGSWWPECRGLINSVFFAKNISKCYKDERKNFKYLPLLIEEYQEVERPRTERLFLRLKLWKTHPTLSHCTIQFCWASL